MQYIYPQLVWPPIAISRSRACSVVHWTFII
jgi:hypothetical protein